jgi:hypothetical protein
MFAIVHNFAWCRSAKDIFFKFLQSTRHALMLYVVVQFLQDQAGGLASLLYSIVLSKGFEE